MSDTGPILHLYEADALSLLKLAGTIYIPPVVNVELAPRIRELPNWIIVRALSPPYASEAVDWREIDELDAGEAEAIALAREISADWLLTDDVAARLVARSVGIEIHGSLGIVVWAAANQHLNRDESYAALDRLERSSLWLSDAIRVDVRAALDRLFA